MIVLWVGTVCGRKWRARQTYKKIHTDEAKEKKTERKRKGERRRYWVALLSVKEYSSTQWSRSHSAQQYGRHHTHQVQSLRLTDGTFPSFALLFRSHLFSFSCPSRHQNKTHIQAYKISNSTHISRRDYTISCTLWRKRWGRSNSWALSLFYIWGWRNN